MPLLHQETLHLYDATKKAVYCFLFKQKPKPRAKKKTPRDRIKTDYSNVREPGRVSLSFLNDGALI